MKRKRFLSVLLCGLFLLGSLGTFRVEAAGNNGTNLLDLTGEADLTDVDLSAYGIILAPDEGFPAALTDGLAGFFEAGGILVFDGPDFMQAICRVHDCLGAEVGIYPEYNPSLSIGGYVYLDREQLSIGVLSAMDFTAKRDREQPDLFQNLPVKSCFNPLELVQIVEENKIRPHNDAPYAASRTSSNSFSLRKDGHRYGCVTLTMYVYDLQSYDESGKAVEIYDVFSKVTVDTSHGAFLSGYTVRMKTSAMNMSIIDCTWLESYLASTGVHSLAAGSGRTAVLGQSVLNNFASDYYSDWQCSPSLYREDITWWLAPGVRLMNKNSKSAMSCGYVAVPSIALWYISGGYWGSCAMENTAALSYGGRWNWIG